MPIDAHSLNQGFVTEGRFLAFPLAMPDETYPLPPDESRVTSLLVTADGLRVYGTTGGERCHVFVASHKGAAGGVLDLGVIPNATSLPCLLPAADEGHGDPLMVGANTPQGFALYRFAAGLPQDTIQEPGFVQPDFEEAAREPDHVLVDANAGAGNEAWCLTDGGMLRLNPETGERHWLDGGAPGRASRLVELSGGKLAWLDAKGTVHAVHVASGDHESTDLGLPAPGAGSAFCAFGESLVCADGEGLLRLIDLDGGTVREIGRTCLPHVQCLAALPDGRVYGACGTGIGHFFRAHLGNGNIADLGAIVSVVVAKRYGFEFSCAVIGRDGEVCLGENDRGGHLWVYLPPVATAN